MGKNKNYLPSKKFIYSIATTVALGFLFLLISNLVSKKNFFQSKNNNLTAGNLTISNLLQKDSDGDGVADWEEALWTTDPNKKATFDGVPDAEYITKKKEQMKIASGNTDQNGKTLSETDKFAQEFFASLTAMKQSGQIDQNTINNVAGALGEKIIEPNLENKYTMDNITFTKGDTKTEQVSYYIAIKNLFESYQKKGIGNELGIASEIAGAGSMANSPDLEKKLTSISSLYQEFVQKSLILPAPLSLAPYHLLMINNANNTGIAVSNMSKITVDPIVGLSGLSQYQKYSDDFVSTVNEMETFLTDNDIIKE